MTPREIDLVGTSFARIDDPQAVAQAFYRRLFEMDPALKALFRGDMEAQGQKLMTTLAMAVNGLRKVELLVPALEMLGRRHVAYGVKDEHYPLVGRALIEALGDTLGESFSEEVKEAWTEAYALMADTMRRAASAATVASG